VKDVEREPSFNSQLAPRFARNCTKLTDATMNHLATTALGALGLTGVSVQLLAVLLPTSHKSTESDTLFVLLPHLTAQRLVLVSMPVLPCLLRLVLPLVLRCRLNLVLTLDSALKIAL
jgi:hypothetical protein